MYLIYNPRTERLLIVHPHWSERPFVNVEGEHGHNYDLHQDVIERYFIYIGEL